MDWEKTTARWYEKHWSFEIRCDLYLRFDGIISFAFSIVLCAICDTLLSIVQAALLCVFLLFIIALFFENLYSCRKYMYGNELIGLVTVAHLLIERLSCFCSNTLMAISLQDTILPQPTLYVGHPPLITRFMGPTWGRQDKVGPMWTTWTLLSG